MEQELTQERTIRSFVKRKGRVTNSQLKALENCKGEFLLNLNILSESKQGKLNPQDIFNNQNKTVLEIGFGNGQSLIKMAENDPNTNFIGIEVYDSGVGAILNRISCKGLTNIRVFHEDAVNVLANMMDCALDRVQLFFPDPWHKKRHNKRRIVQNSFATLVASKLKNKGIFHLATDWEPYALHMLEVLDNHNKFQNLEGLGGYSQKPEYRPITKFEIRGHRLGHSSYDLIYIKK